MRSRRSRVAKITRGGDGNSYRKLRSNTLANDRRDVEDHSLSKYDRVYNYQTKSTTRGENRGSRMGITNAFTFGTWQEPTKGARTAGMFIVNKHYDIIFCHNNGRRCYKRFSHEAAVGYHRGQWERPRYAVNWFAKAFLKKPSAESQARRRRTCRPGWRGDAGVGGGGWRELLSLYRKNYVAAGIVFMLHNYATRDRSDSDRGKGGETDAGAS